MKNVAIITDTIACLTPEQVKKHDIVLVPPKIYSAGQVYRDGVDITPAQAYELFLKDPETFKTSGPSPEDCLQAYRVAAQNYSSALFITCSSQISMIYNSAVTALDIAEKELPGIHIEVLDSCTATPSEGLIVLAAAEAAATGADLMHVIATAQNIRQKVNCIVFLETLRYVYRSGRIPKLASTIGSSLNIRPVFTVKKTIRFIGISHSKEGCIQRTFDMMHKDIGGKPIRAAVTHAYAPEEAENFMEMVNHEFQCSEIWITEFSPIMGYSCGTGTLGVAYHTV